MDNNVKIIYDAKKLLISKYPSFGGELASINIEYKSDLKYHTAATDGKNIYIDSNYFSSLSEDDKVFLIAHEIMHIKLNHVFRLLDKNGNKRDCEAWNEATDAIINANLERDGFKIKDGYINRPEALDYSAEEFYEIVLKERQNKKNNSNNDEYQENDSDNNYGDDHSLWEEAFQKKQENKMGNSNNESQEKQDSEQFNEKEWFSKNRDERRTKAKEKLENMRNQLFKNMQTDNTSEEIHLGNVGNANESIDWRILLRRDMEKNEIIWSQRRSIAENNYAYRLEEIDIDDDAQTEVMIDVSGSVDIELVKSFLRILKPLLPHSKLKVGCFNEKFWGMVEIKTTKDIDNFIIPSGARGSSSWTEDWDLAVRSFTKKSEINKIVFTDGYPAPGVMPKEDLKHENIIWLVYGNDKFHPCCGKVINITEKQLNEMYIFDRNESDFKKFK